jgi:hypothetical protein
MAWGPAADDILAIAAEPPLIEIDEKNARIPC